MKLNFKIALNLSAFKYTFLSHVSYSSKVMTTNLLEEIAYMFSGGDAHTKFKFRQFNTLEVFPWNKELYYILLT
jgi:hypothetical protein